MASEAEKREQFKAVLDPWLEYWGKASMTQFQWKEWYATFGSWSSKRLTDSFRLWKQNGARFPTEKDILQMDRKIRDEKKNRQVSMLNDGDLNRHSDMAQRLLSHKIDGTPMPQSEDTFAFQFEPLVSRAFEIFESHQPPEHYSERLKSNSKRSMAFGTLHMMVAKELRGGI